MIHFTAPLPLTRLRRLDWMVLSVSLPFHFFIAVLSASSKAGLTCDYYYTSAWSARGRSSRLRER